MSCKIHTVSSCHVLSASCPVKSVQYPHVFEEPIVENIKNWVMDETARFSGEDRNSRHDVGKREASDSEMLRTYSTGLLVLCLSGYT